MRFPRQEYWGGLPFLSPEDLPDPGIKPASPALAGGFFTIEPPGKPKMVWGEISNIKQILFNSLEIWWLTLHVSIADCMSLIPGWGTKIPHACCAATNKLNGCQYPYLARE